MYVSSIITPMKIYNKKCLKKLTKYNIALIIYNYTVHVYNN